MEDTESPAVGEPARPAPRADMMVRGSPRARRPSRTGPTATSRPDQGRDGVRDGLLRLREVLAPGGPVPVSKSTWWAGVKTGRYPKPVKLGPRITAWKSEDIRALADGREPS